FLPHRFLHRLFHRSTIRPTTACNPRWISKAREMQKDWSRWAIAVYFPSSSDAKAVGEIGERSRTRVRLSEQRATLRSKRLRAGRKPAASDVRSHLRRRKSS